MFECFEFIFYRSNFIFFQFSFRDFCEAYASAEKAYAFTPFLRLGREGVRLLCYSHFLGRLEAFSHRLARLINTFENTDAN